MISRDNLADGNGGLCFSLTVWKIGEFMIKREMFFSLHKLIICSNAFTLFESTTDSVAITDWFKISGSYFNMFILITFFNGTYPSKSSLRAEWVFVLNLIMLIKLELNG